MRLTVPPRFLHPLILVLTFALSSCGGGTDTAGAGGSGIGGTGITTVTGNISQVVALAPQDDQPLARSLLAGAFNWFSTPVNAQSTPPDDDQRGGIQVFGGGQLTTTNDDGEFVLEDVEPSDNFVLRFVFEENQTVTTSIGPVPPGALVTVSDIVVDTEQGFANPGSVRVEENRQSNNGNSQNASNNNNATGASGNRNDNASEIAGNASNNNNANDASNGANANK